MFEALVGRHPFYDPGMSMIDIMTRTRTKEPHEIKRADLNDDDPIREIILRLLARNPHGRFRNTDALREALETAR